MDELEVQERKSRIAKLQEQYGIPPTTPEEVEPGIEEGDWLDYLFTPASLIKSGGKSAMKVAANAAKAQGKQSALNRVKEQMPERPNTIDYSKGNIGHKPTYTDTSGPGGKNIGNEILKKRSKQPLY